MAKKAIKPVSVLAMQEAQKSSIKLKKSNFKNPFRQLVNWFISSAVKQIVEEELKQIHELVAKRNKVVNDHINKITDILDVVTQKITPEVAQKIKDPALHTFEKKGLTIRVKNGGDIDTTEFFVSKHCWIDGRADFYVSHPYTSWVHYSTFNSGKQFEGSVSIKDGSCPSILSFVETIFKTGLVSKIKAYDSMDFVLAKSGALTWDEVLPKVLDAIASLFPDVPNEETTQGILEIISEKEGVLEIIPETE